MALSRASCWLIALLLAGAAGAQVPLPDRSEHIRVESSSFDLDYKNNTLAYNAVRITQGAYAIQADRATASGLDFKAARWVLTGNVRITIPDGWLSSDEAHIEFIDDVVANAQITGTPAMFEQKHDKRTATGHARHIDYDFGAATVRLYQEAEVTDGTNRISGEVLTYDMRTQRLHADKSADDPNGGPVRIVITPKKPDPKPNP